MQSSATVLGIRWPQPRSSRLAADPSAAPTFQEIAAIASELTGRTVECVAVAEDEWLAAQIDHGTPEFMASLLLGFYRAAQQGCFAGVDPLLGKLLGREPRTARDFLAETPAG